MLMSLGDRPGPSPRGSGGLPLHVPHAPSAKKVEQYCLVAWSMEYMMCQVCVLLDG